MEDFEKKDNDLVENEEISKTNEAIEESQINEASESGASTESSLVADPTPADILPEERTVYHWSYAEIDGEDKKKKGKKRGVAVYAAAVSVAFLICFAALVFTLLFDFVFVPKSTENTEALPQNVVRVEERVVYVREYDSESGVLTPQEIYNKCLPATVSIIVSNGTDSGSGSGFFITEDGYIVTANHVVEDMSSITVVTSSGEMYDASIIGGNAYTDLAVIKIEKSDCPIMKAGSSDKLLAGDDVVAIGTPASIDFAGSFVKGSVSYKNRMLKIYNQAGTAVEKKMKLIQTDALVNPGNSGCALINEYGEMVGIVTMKLNSTYYEGMCFAIPSDAAMPIINAMIKGENYDSLLGAISTKPAVLGIAGANVVLPDLAISGVKIDSFSSASYDASTKLKVGDIITKMDGIAVKSITELRLLLDKKLPGDTAEITFYRDGQTMTVFVTLGA